MITLVKWIARFIIWILLYYIFLIKISPILVGLDISGMKNFNLILLYTAIAMSLLMSPKGGSFNWGTFKDKIHMALIPLVVPIVILVLNYGIISINWISEIVNAPKIDTINFVIHIVTNPSCGCGGLNGVGMFYVVTTIVSFIIFLSVKLSFGYDD
jgi:hypothetical protein